MPITSSQSHRTYIDKIAMRTNCAKLHGQTGETRQCRGWRNLNRANQGEAKVKGESSNMLYYFALNKKLHYIELVFPNKFILTTYGYTLYCEL